jgi:hypothetical protein
MRAVFTDPFSLQVSSSAESSKKKIIQKISAQHRRHSSTHFGGIRLTLYELFSGASRAAIEARFAGKGYADLKRKSLTSLAPPSSLYKCGIVKSWPTRRPSTCCSQTVLPAHPCWPRKP